MKALVLCSGGIDSVVTAHHVKNTGKYSEINVIFFNIGQNSLEFERKFAKGCAEDIGAGFLEYDLASSGIYQDLPNLENVSITREDLANSEKHSKRHYIPGRNLVFLSYALSVAEKMDLSSSSDIDIFVGFTSEGRDSYPDTTKEFVSGVNAVALACNLKGITIIAPFIDKDKEDVIEEGNNLGVDLANTISCYFGQQGSCGKCLACMRRKEAFYWAGINDPTHYLKI